MAKGKKYLSLILAVLMIATSFPLTAFTAFAAGSRHDFKIDFDYEYDTPEQALLAADNWKNVKRENISSDPELKDIFWRHINYFLAPDAAAFFGTKDNPYYNAELQHTMMSTSKNDEYLVLDNDIELIRGHSDYTEIVVTKDKVLDLNGHSITLIDKRNKVDTHNKDIDEYYQSNDSHDFNTVMFRVQNGATLTIIDSSAKGNGKISINAYMVNPYKHAIKRYTTRDIFAVEDGNLVVYGGTFVAGRSKQQSDDDTWDKIKTVVGSAVSLATDIAGFATPINSATGKLKDVNFNVSKALEELKKGDNSGSDPEDGSSSTANVNKDRSEGEPEKKQETPLDKEDSNGRNKTVDEKQKDSKKTDEAGKKNEANANGTAKKDFDGYSKIAEAQNAVVNAATNKDTLGKMVDSAFKFVDTVKDAFGTNEGSIVTQSFLGTVVSVGNGGTFVSYGGTYIGYGMTPSTRNAVVEVTQGVFDADGKQVAGGKVYVFDGIFEGRCGANIFNITKTNNKPQTVTLYEADAKGVRVAKTVTVPLEETGGKEVVMLDPTSTEDNIKLIDTKNVRIRGGIFRNYCEYSMLGLSNVEPGAKVDAKGQMTMFAGTSGSINLGVTSFGEDLIRDGRIQIVDNHGDGALVLMDSEKDERGLNHHRLYCSDNELRYKQYITVYPTESVQNSSYSFTLSTRYNGADTGDDISEIWAENEENVRGVYSNDEKFFKVEIDGDSMDTYYVCPDMANPNDVYNVTGDESETWYYNTPTSVDGKKIGNFTTGFNFGGGVFKNTDTKGYETQYKDLVAYNKYLGTYFTPETLTKNVVNYSYLKNVKWLTYKIYKVDPLTRENLTDTYGEDQPIRTVVYGASTDEALRCQLPINKLGIDYKRGEMYRIELTVDEYVNFGNEYYWMQYDAKRFDENSKTLKKSSCKSSILFLCYSKDELIDYNDGGPLKADYTPLQWVTPPEAGKVATVQIVNGKAGQIDWHDRKIFEVYYQWYARDKKTGKVELIAGTDNIYDDITLKDYQYHKFANWQNDTTHQYKNTQPLSSDRSSWTYKDIHFYPQAAQKNVDFTKDGSSNLSLDNNNVFFTNTDSCYIPETYTHHEIYCKAVVVNNFWPLNFDHKQTFRTPRESISAMNVTFNTDGGNLSGESTKQVCYGKAFGTMPSAYKTGYVFDGWYDENGQLVTADTIVRIEQDFTLTAKYTAKQIEVTFNAGSGTLPEELTKKTVSFDSAYGELPIPTLPGYMFTGWFNTVGEKVDADTICKWNNATQRLGARYEREVTITLNVNGGKLPSGVSSSVKVAANKAIGDVLPTPTRSGYAFRGWAYYDSNGNFIKYFNAGSSISTNVTLKADWGEGVTVTLNANGGSVSQSTVALVNGSKYGVLPIPTRTNYKFIGWYTRQTGGTRVYADTVFDKLVNGTTLYAHWDATVATVYFVPEKGSSTVYAVAYTAQGGYIADGDWPATPKKEGYVFNGWRRETDSSSSTNYFGSKDKCYDGIRVYAVWSPVAITVTFNANGGYWYNSSTYSYDTAGTRDYFVEYGSFLRSANTSSTNWGYYITADKGKPQRGFEYKFLGWFTEPTGGKEVQLDTRIEWTENRTYYAHWEAQECYYNLELDYPGAPIMSQIKIVEGQPWGELPVPEREGYTFIGWFTGNNLIKITPDHISVKKEIADNMGDRTGATNTLFARWITEAAHIEIDYCNPEKANTTFIARPGTAFGTLPTATRNGYTFAGWFTEKDGGEKITSTTIYNGEIEKLYAHWIKAGYKVTVNPGVYGTATTDKTAAAKGDSVTLTVTPDDDCKITSVTSTPAVDFEIIGSTYHFVMPEKDIAIKVSFHKHSWSIESVIAPTEAETGYEIYTCSCKEKKVVAIPYVVTEHSLTFTAATTATCSKAGSKAYYQCEDCLKLFSDYTAKNEITRESVVVPATAHKWDSGKVTKAATCTASGTKTFSCTVCGTTKTETIAKLGHKYDEKITKATQTKDGKIQSVCSVCGYTKTTSTVIPMISEFTLSTSTYTYTGSAKKPTVTVKDSKGNKLVKDTDYTVTYSNNTNIGTATAKVTFKGKYSGTKSIEYKIIPAAVTGLTATQTANSVTLSWTKVAGAASYKIYTYSATTKKYTQKTSTTSTSCTIKDLKAGTAYTYYVKASKTVDSKAYNSSKYTKIATGTRPANVTGLTATQTTSTVKLSWTKVTNATGYKVYKYSSTTKKYSLVGSSTTTSYTVKSLKAGTAYTYYVKAYRTIDGKDILSASYTKIMTGTKTSTPSAPTLTAGTKKVTAKWTKVTGATGYELYMAPSKTGTYSKIYTGTALTYTKSSLTTGKTMYFKVRTYKTVDGKKIYSAYSSIVSTKVK